MEKCKVQSVPYGTYHTSRYYSSKRTPLGIMVNSRPIDQSATLDQQNAPSRQPTDNVVVPSSEVFAFDGCKTRQERSRRKFLISSR